MNVNFGTWKSDAAVKKKKKVEVALELGNGERLEDLWGARQKSLDCLQTVYRNINVNDSTSEDSEESQVQKTYI